MLPFLRGMKDVENFDGIALNSVGDDVGSDDDFAGQGHTTVTPAFWKLFEALATIPDALSFGEHDFDTRPLCKVGPDPIKVLERVWGPTNPSRCQRSAPTWRRLP